MHPFPLRIQALQDCVSSMSDSSYCENAKILTLEHTPARAMAANTSEKCLEHHVATRVEDCVVVMSASTQMGHLKDILIYNLWTDHWRKSSISHMNQLPSTEHLCCLAIGKTIYMFDGWDTRYWNAGLLWKLRMRNKDSFELSVVYSGASNKRPSPRFGVSCWEYEDKLWIFGGMGESHVGYLHENDYGKYEMTDPYDQYYVNNELFCFDTTNQTWKSVKSDGNVPSPRSDASTARINDRVWLYSGELAQGKDNSMYELNLVSHTWTQIVHNGHNTGPPERLILNKSLTPITAHQLVLYSNLSGKSWIFDVQSYTWTMCRPKVILCSCFCSHSATTGLNNDVKILSCHRGATCKRNISSTGPLVSVMLEPKHLEQLAMAKIYENRSQLPCHILPSSLTRKLMGEIIDG